MRPVSISKAAARRIAIAAQGLHGRPNSAGLRQFTSSVQRMGVLQIDSVNVVARSQYLPLFARLGPYDRDILRRASEESPRRMVESWAHVAAFVPVEIYPALRWRQRDRHDWASVAGVAHTHPQVLLQILAVVAEHGPLTPTELRVALGHSRVADRSGWGWNWSVVKTATEHLFAAGDLAVAGRTSQFERRFDLPERVLPAHVLAEDPAEPDARRRLIEIAARAHGVASLACLADYFRQRLAPARRAVSELVEEGVLTPVVVHGWDQPLYLHAQARRPTAVTGRALLSPFDPLIWFRPRTEQLFDLRYRIEIYTPAAKRVHGYYVLPFLLGEQLAARVDLKADRTTGDLLVQSVWRTAHSPPETAQELAAELTLMADWLGLQRIRVAPRGDLAPQLAAVTALGDVSPARPSGEAGRTAPDAPERSILRSPAETAGAPRRRPGSRG